MTHLPFDRPGRFLRGNLHTHSTASDGVLSVDAVCAKYRDAGYDFVSITDHALEAYDFPVTDTAACRSDAFTTLIGAELHAGQSEFGNLWHIVANGLPMEFDPRPSGSGPELARRARDAGAFVTIAHPAWYMLTEADVAAFDGIAHAVEVWNGVAGAMQDRFDSWYIADLALHRGLRFLATAADDFHGKPNRDEFEQGWVWVKAEQNEPDSLLAALKAGHFYSSCGPVIHDVRVTPGESVRVVCDAADIVVVTGTRAQAASVTTPGTTEAQLDISRFDSPYLRVTVRDAAGRRAWTNPIWV